VPFRLFGIVELFTAGSHLDKIQCSWLRLDRSEHGSPRLSPHCVTVPIISCSILRLMITDGHELNVPPLANDDVLRRVIRFFPLVLLFYRRIRHAAIIYPIPRRELVEANLASHQYPNTRIDRIEPAEELVDQACLTTPRSLND